MALRSPISISTLSLITITIVLAGFVVRHISREWGFPDMRFPIEKGEKRKLHELGALQTIRSDRDGLSGLNVLFGGSSVKEGGKLSFRLLDESCAKTLHEETRFVDTIDSDTAMEFRFPRIPDSSGKRFCLSLSFDPQPGSKKAFLFTIPNTLPNDTPRLVVNGEERPGESLAIRPVYRNEHLGRDLIELTRRISQYKPWFLKDAMLAMIAAASIGLSFFFVFAVIFSTDTED